MKNEALTNLNQKHYESISSNQYLFDILTHISKDATSHISII